jgi:GT2 family glycosyltransferase
MLYPLTARNLPYDCCIRKRFREVTVGLDLSIIIVNWNTRELVLECLRSLFAATSDISMEVFVVDNGSSDDSVEAIRAAFPRVVLFEKKKNLGFARANNEALRQGGGNYFLLLNTDVSLHEDAIRRKPDGSKQNSFDNFPTLLSEGFNKSLLRVMFPKRYPSKRLSLSPPVSVESVLGACMLVRAKAVDDVGPMDEDYFFFMEETDWCYRMRERGWGVYLVPQAQAVHFQGGTAQSVKAQARVEYYRSRYLFFKKNRGRFQARILGGVLFLKLSMSLLMLSILCLFTFFRSRKAREKLAVSWKLFAWHAQFCPEGMGLRE